MGKTLYETNSNLKKGDLVYMCYRGGGLHKIGIFEEYIRHSHVFGDGAIFREAIYLREPIIFMGKKLPNFEEDIGTIADDVIVLRVGKLDVLNRLKTDPKLRIYVPSIKSLFNID